MKQFVLFIVEGASDEAALNSVLKELYHGTQLRFKVIHGDILTTHGHTARTIKAQLGNVIREYLKRYRLLKSNVAEIIHLIDTDGVFIPDEDVKEDANHLRYQEDGIYTDHVESICARNAQKAENVRVLISCDRIAGITYRMYYFSRNLEHALMGKEDEPEKGEKMDLADAYDIQFKGKLSEWKAHLREPDLAVSGDYRATWDWIMTERNSLRRASNLHLILAHVEDSQS